MSTITDWMQGCAAVSGVGIALVAAWYARSQITAGLQASRESSAMDAYRSYLALCIERPELSSSLLYLKKTGCGSFKGITKELSEDSERYLWFVSNLLNTGEQIVEQYATSLSHYFSGCNGRAVAFGGSLMSSSGNP